MKLDTYEKLAMRTAKRMSKNHDLMHATLGVANESGELASAVKKNFAYSKELDIENVIEELGDLLWFIALAANSINTPLSEIADRNIEKLKKRYPEKYDDELASLRLDKVE